MRLAIIRRHYAADGAVERMVETVFEALLEREVALEPRAVSDAATGFAVVGAKRDDRASAA